MTEQVPCRFWTWSRLRSRPRQRWAVPLRGKSRREHGGERGEPDVKTAVDKAAKKGVSATKAAAKESIRKLAKDAGKP